MVRGTEQAYVSRTVDWDIEILAARPPRWSLARQRDFGLGDDDLGSWEFTRIVVVETDEETGQTVAAEFFDESELDAALALLDDWAQG